jgi:hypothetical protein
VRRGFVFGFRFSLKANLAGKEFAFAQWGAAPASQAVVNVNTIP